MNDPCNRKDIIPESKTARQPEPEQCRTLKLPDGFRQCLGSRSECKFALPAGPVRSLCMHMAHYRYRVQYLKNSEKS